MNVIYMSIGQGVRTCKSILMRFLYPHNRNEIEANMMTKDFEVYLQGKKLPMNKFVANVINDVMMALLNNLHDIEIKKISKIQID